MKMTQRHYDQLAIGVQPALEKTPCKATWTKG